MLKWVVCFAALCPTETAAVASDLFYCAVRMRSCWATKLNWVTGCDSLDAAIYLDPAKPTPSRKSSARGSLWLGPLRFYYCQDTSLKTATARVSTQHLERYKFTASLLSNLSTECSCDDPASYKLNLLKWNGLMFAVQRPQQCSFPAEIRHAECVEAFKSKPKTEHSVSCLFLH